MRPVLFTLQPLGTGKVYRSLAIAETLKKLYPAVAPHFLTGGAAAELLRSADRFPVEDGLTPIVPIREGASSDQEIPGQIRRLAPAHARCIREVARRLPAEMVISDGLLAAPTAVRRLGLPCVLLTDHLLEVEAARSWWQRGACALLRRSLVGTTKLRFFVGELSHIESPELRVWARRFFRFSGPISGLARLDRQECATLRDDLGLGTAPLLTICAGGSAFQRHVLDVGLEALELLQAELPELRTLVVAGPELTTPETGKGTESHSLLPDLARHLAISDACLIPAGVSLLSETAGLGLPTLCLPTPGHEEQARTARWFAERCGVQVLSPEAARPSRVAERLRLLLQDPQKFRCHSLDDAAQQRRSAHYVADLIAEALGRRRPT